MSHDPERIRNVSVIAHVDHGKTTLSDHILGSGGIIPRQLVGSVRALDDLEEEQKRGITIESSVATVDIPYEDGVYKLNLIDTPGHIDFNSKVAEALRLVDGSMILVDAVEGIMAQTLTVLRQSLREFIQPILVINKIDRLINELEYTVDEIQRRIQNIIVETRNICKSQEFEGLNLPNFGEGSVLLISAIDGWGISFKTAKSNGITMERIIVAYQNDTIDVLAQEIPLMKVIGDTIFECLPSPVVAQKLKFPSLIRENIHDEILTDIHQCNAKGSPVVLVGKIQLVGRSGLYGSLIRVLSGTLAKNAKLWSSLHGTEHKISRLVIIKGSRIVEAKELKAGDVGAVIIRPLLMPGDVLTAAKEIVMTASNIGYVQEPVVSITVEPVHIKDIGKIQVALEDLAKITPGLEFETESDTGELKALGVGPLQLEIMVKDLESKGLEIETTSPMVLRFDQPLYETEFESSSWPGIIISAGRKEHLPDKEGKRYDVYADTYNNSISISGSFSFSAEAVDGLREVFRQSVRVSPLTGNHVRNLKIIIEERFLKESIKSYEMGMVAGLGITREALQQTGSRPHEPHYNLEVTVPESYLGPVLQELQKLQVVINDIHSDGSINTIYAQLYLGDADNLAETLRSVSDGNAFWSFTGVRFVPSK